MPVEAQAPGRPSLVDVQQLGPQPGEKVPDFALPDQFGQRRTLTSLMGPKGLMLVFYASAEWSPACEAQLVDLQARRAEIGAAGFGLAAISYDTPATLQRFAARRGVTFPLLSDRGSDVIRRFGIFNTTIAESDRVAYGTPFPGTFLVDRNGRVESRLFARAHEERFTANAVLLKAGSRLSVPVTRVTTPQLAVTTFATDAAVASGAVFDLVVEGAPSAGMHVYAPGVTGYGPLSLVIEPTPGLQVRGIEYPPSELFHFVPLDERVPVFQRPFRVVQEVAVGGGGVTGDMTIRGTLHYQACSDAVCFPAQNVPLVWRVAVRRLDRGRAQP